MEFIENIMQRKRFNFSFGRKMKISNQWISTKKGALILQAVLKFRPPEKFTRTMNFRISPWKTSICRLSVCTFREGTNCWFLMQVVRMVLFSSRNFYLHEGSGSSRPRPILEKFLEASPNVLMISHVSHKWKLTPTIFVLF